MPRKFRIPNSLASKLMRFCSWMSQLDDYSDREFGALFGVAKQTVEVLYAVLIASSISWIGIDKILWMLYFFKVSRRLLGNI